MIFSSIIFYQLADAEYPATRHKAFLHLFFAKDLDALFENLEQIAARFQAHPINHHPRTAWK
jgi:hypothetical protein